MKCTNPDNQKYVDYYIDAPYYNGASLELSVAIDPTGFTHKKSYLSHLAILVSDALGHRKLSCLSEKEMIIVNNFKE